MEHELERIREDFALDDLDNVEEEEEDLEQWAPFKSKMDFVGCLLVGWYKRNLISRTLFDQIRLILNGLCQLKIPAWSTIHRSQKRIRDLLGLQIQMQESVWSTPGAALSSRRALQQDLSKPLVAPFFDFYPEYTKGVNQYKLSQSQKWLNMSPSLRTQMCANNTKHFYIFEPVETYSKHILVPIFIYTKDGERHAKCVIPTLKLTGPTTYQLEIQRHIDFNDPELLSIKTKEFDKEYIEIKQNNQLLSEICGNEIPNHAPKSIEDKSQGEKYCEIFPLACTSMSIGDFVYHFFHRDCNGNASPNDPRVWKETVERTHELTKVATEDTMKEYNVSTKKYGVKDWINESQGKDGGTQNGQLFSLVNSARSGEYIAQVNSVWKHSASFFAHVTKFKGSKMNTFYMMREFVKTNKACSIMVQDIMATLNLQHNCHDGECLIEKTKVTEVERQDTDVEEYWRLTRLSYNQPTEEDIVTAMTGGHLAWKGHCQKTMPCKKKKVGKRMVHMTSDTEWGSSGEIS
ncbi:hypothetical protein PSTT_02151, partial [Puccinia striiformis]